MADPALNHQTQSINKIAIDYTPEACTHCPQSNSITLTYDHRGGARWRSTTRFLYGTFSSLIQCPKGNTSGLNFNIYLSSLEGDKSQDEIDFEFLGKDKTIVQTNYFTTGIEIPTYIDLIVIVLRKKMTVSMQGLGTENKFMIWVLIALMGFMSMWSSGVQIL